MSWLPNWSEAVNRFFREDFKLMNCKDKQAFILPLLQRLPLLHCQEKWYCYLQLINGFDLGSSGLIRILPSFWSSAWKSWMPITIFGPSTKSGQWNSAKRWSAKIQLNCFCKGLSLTFKSCFHKLNTLVNLRFPSWTRKHKSWRRRWCKVIRLLRRFKICKESTFSAHGLSPTLLWWGWTQN